MFRKLRIKMTVINAAVTMALFLILILGAYALLHFNIQKGSAYFLDKVAASVLSGKLQDIPVRREKKDGEKPPFLMLAPPRPSFFFVKLTPDGALAFRSSGVTVESGDLPALTASALSSAEEAAPLAYKDIPFRFKRAALPDGGALVVFHDLSNERASMQAFLRNLLLVGLFCSLLSFAVSFLMAGRAIRPIQEASERQKNFVSDASHDLRTPLAILQTNLEILRGAPPGETIADNRKWLDNLQSETTRMTELVNALLFLARADADQQKLECETFPLDSVLKDALYAFEPLAEAKGIALRADLPSGALWRGDANRMRQLLTILLDNALRHTERGSIALSLSAEPDAFLIRLTDTGEGIAAKHLPHLFDRFYQVDESRHKGGSGLGLALAKWIVKQHRGAISITSASEKGTTVSIRLPRN